MISIDLLWFFLSIRFHTVQTLYHRLLIDYLFTKCNRKDVKKNYFSNNSTCSFPPSPCFVLNMRHSFLSVLLIKFRSNITQDEEINLQCQLHKEKKRQKREGVYLQKTLMEAAKIHVLLALKKRNMQCIFRNDSFLVGFYIRFNSRCFLIFGEEVQFILFHFIEKVISYKAQ